jgi:hypothetical protein
MLRGKLSQPGISANLLEQKSFMCHRVTHPQYCGVIRLRIRGFPFDQVSTRMKGAERHRVETCPSTISIPRTMCDPSSGGELCWKPYLSGLRSPHATCCLSGKNLFLASFEKGLSWPADLVRHTNEILWTEINNLKIWCKQTSFCLQPQYRST